MLKNLYSLFIKDFQLMAAGRFFPVALGSLLFYTLFINLVYVRYVNDELYNIYLYPLRVIQIYIVSPPGHTIYICMTRRGYRRKCPG